MLRPARVRCGVVGENRKTHPFAIVTQIHPVHDDVVFDLIPALEERVRVSAFTNIVSGIFVNGRIAKIDREECLEFPTSIVLRSAPLTSAILGFDVPRISDPSFLLDRKSTRLNSSHLGISYAVFCLKKK